MNPILYVRTKYGMATTRKTSQWADVANDCVGVAFAAEIKGRAPLILDYVMSVRLGSCNEEVIDEERRHLIRQAIEAALDPKPAPQDEPSPACPFAVGDRVYHITQQGVFKMAVVKPGPEQTLCEWFDVSRSPVLRKFDNRNIVKDGSGV